jgi:hypothetical protein
MANAGRLHRQGVIDVAAFRKPIKLRGSFCHLLQQEFSCDVRVLFGG